MKTYTKQQTIKLVQEFIDKYSINITLEEIQKMIYETMDHKPIFQLWMMLCENAWLEIEQAEIDLITNCWNNFPHKDLWGKSPCEVRR